MEALRYLPFLAPDGWIVTNTTAFVNIPNYPDQDKVLSELKSRKNVILLDVDATAREAGNPRGANITLLGACSNILGIDADKLEAGIRDSFSRKGEAVVEANIAAFRAGRSAAVTR